MVQTPNDVQVVRYTAAVGAAGVGVTSTDVTSIQNRLTALEALILSGAGSPEGVVTAPVGKQYNQTDGDSLTATWKKAQGSGNTGWLQNDGFLRKRLEMSYTPNLGDNGFIANGLTAGTVLSGTGASATRSSNTAGRWSILQSGNANGDYAQLTTSPIVRLQHAGSEAVYHIRPHDLTSVRILVGLFASDPHAASSPLIEHAAFRFDDSLDSFWKIRCGDGASSTQLNCSVAPVADQDYYLRIVFWTSSRIRFYLDDRFEGEITATLPGTGTSLTSYVNITTLTALAKQLYAGPANFQVP